MNYTQVLRVDKWGGQQYCFLFFCQNNQSVRQFRLVSKEMLRSQQLISLSCCHRSGREFASIGNMTSSFFSRRFGACSNITREVDDYGKEKKVFFLLIHHSTSLLFFCWFNRPTNGQFFIWAFFVKYNCCVDNSIEREEQKKNNANARSWLKRFE